MAKKKHIRKIPPRSFFIAICCIVLLLPFGIFLSRQIDNPIIADVNEMTQLPIDVGKVENQIYPNPLIVNLPKPTATPKPIPSSFKVPVLLYHYVEYVKDRGDKTRISLNIEPQIFEEQVKTLKDAGFTFMFASDIPKLFTGEMDLPEHPVVLTFDDGYRDFYTDVFPILKKYNVKAVSYVVPGFLDKPNNLTHQQLAEIDQSGLVEIADHTLFHTYLKGTDKKRVEYEVLEGKASLERDLHHPITDFAYPYGAFDLQAIEVVKEAGFQTAASTLPGTEIKLDNLLFFPRIRPGYRTGTELLNYIKAS